MPNSQRAGRSPRSRAVPSRPARTAAPPAASSVAHGCGRKKRVSTLARYRRSGSRLPHLAAPLGRVGRGQYGTARPSVEEEGAGQGAGGEAGPGEQGPEAGTAPADSFRAFREDEDAVEEGEEQQEQPFRPGEDGDGEDGERERRAFRIGPLAQMEDHPPEREQDEERDLHPRQGRPDEPAGRQGEPGGEGGEPLPEAELAGEAPGGVDPGEVEGDAEELGPDHDAPRQEEEEREEGGPERRRRAGHHLAGVVGEPGAVREVARELQMDPTVVQRKAQPALEAGDLRERGSAGRRRGRPGAAGAVVESS